MQDETADLVFTSGYLKPLLSCTIADKEAILSAVVMNQTIYRCKAEIDQFAEGLDSVGVFQCVKEHPTLFKDSFCFSKPSLTGLDLRNLFLISYSPQGSNIREREEEAVLHWFNYIDECEGI